MSEALIHPDERDAWRALDAKLRPFVTRRIASQADADDVMQTIYLRMQRSVTSLQDDQRFGPWVYSIARNAITDHYRHRARHPSASAVAAIDLGDASTVVASRASEPPPGFGIASHDDTDEGGAASLAPYIAAFIASLPSPYAEALTLTELEGLTQREAAEMVGISLPGMKSRVQRGRALLKAAIESACRITLDTRGNIMACEPRLDGSTPDGCCS